MLTAVCSPSYADAGSASNREGKWEMYFSPNYVNSSTLDGEGGSSADINGDLGWLFGFAYNLNEKFALGFEFGWNSVSYTANRAYGAGLVDRAGGTLDTSGTRLYATYNFMAKRFTPYVTGNIGWTWIDTNVPSGPPSTSCWYDPWLGYICSGYQPTYTTTEFTYGGSLGLRFDVSNNVFLRGSVGEQWLDVNTGGGTPSFTNYRLDIGFLF
jgi:hypothetical protein